MFSFIKKAVKKTAELFKEKGSALEDAEKSSKVILEPSAKTKLKSLLRKKYFLSEKDLLDLKEKLELVLLQSDFSVELIDAVLPKYIDRLREGIPKEKDFDIFLRELFLETIFDLLPKDRPYYSKKRPFVILFTGLNGAGKTTAIAKLAKKFKDSSYKVLLCAADTYRAGAIEQLKEHADNLSLQIVLSKYGQDPASVAYDALKLAEKRHFDFLLIDSSGRQSTSKDLLKELEKLYKVSRADLVFYVAESISGQSALENARIFNDYAPIDFFIITKADIDSKGGTAFSLSYAFSKAVAYISYGQEYDKLKEFSKSDLAKLWE